MAPTLEKHADWYNNSIQYLNMPVEFLVQNKLLLVKKYYSIMKQQA